jgi:glycosyl transferase family 22 (putative mannosyltransferase)
LKSPFSGVSQQRLLGWLQWALMLAFAVRSYDTFFGDEHYQIIEFASVKLGYTAPVLGDVPWEWQARVRPWLQPSLYTLLIGTARTLGLEDPYQQAALCRLATGAAYVVGLRQAERVGRHLLPEAGRRGLRILGTVLGFLYYLGVRHSSEALSAVLLMWMLGALVEQDEASRWSRLPSRMALAGAFAGLAFEVRYQTAFFVIGGVAWYLVRVRPGARGWLAAVGGTLSALVLGTLADRWGYGAWVLTPLRYFQMLIPGGIAASMGTDPFYAYLYYLPANYFFPVSLLSLVSMFAFWVRRPDNPVTMGSTCFFFAHCLIAHKEERFLFPLVPLIPTFIVGAWLPAVGTRWNGFASWVWKRRKSPLAFVALGWNAVATLFLLIWTGNRDSSFPSATWMLRHLPAHAVVLRAFQVVKGPGTLLMTEPPRFYVRGRLQVVIEPSDACEAATAGRPVFLWSDVVLPEAAREQMLAMPLHNDFPWSNRPGALVLVRKLRDAYEGARRAGIGLPRVAWHTVYALGAPCSPALAGWVERQVLSDSTPRANPQGASVHD